MANILYRSKHLINTDPQKRCYNGCYAKSEIVWSDWEVLEYDVKNPDKGCSFGES